VAYGVARNRARVAGVRTGNGISPLPMIDPSTTT